MAEASVLSLKPKRKDINKYRELDDEWYSLGVELDVEEEELDDLEKHSDPHKRLIKMFVVWLEKGKKPTYRKLLKALVDLDKRNIAQSISAGLGKYINYYKLLFQFRVTLMWHYLHLNSAVWWETLERFAIWLIFQRLPNLKSPI